MTWDDLTDDEQQVLIDNAEIVHDEEADFACSEATIRGRRVRMAFETRLSGIEVEIDADTEPLYFEVVGDL